MRIGRMIIAAALISTLTVTPAFAFDSNSTQADISAEFASYEAQRQANSQTVKQNKAAYEASSTALMKQVDALLDEWSWADGTQAAVIESQIQQIMAENSATWASQFHKVALTDPLPAGATLIKSGYKYDNDAIIDGDLRPWIWVFENGKMYVMTMSTLDDVNRHGSFAAYKAYISNPPTGGSFVTDEGNVVFWGDWAE